MDNNLEHFETLKIAENLGTPKTPVNTETPKTPENTKGPKTSESPKIPEYTDTLKISENFESPKTSEISETPKTPEISEAPKTPEISEASKTPEISEASKIPETSETPKTPDISETPKTQEHSETFDNTRLEYFIRITNKDVTQGFVDAMAIIKAMHNGPKDELMKTVTAINPKPTIILESLRRKKDKLKVNFDVQHFKCNEIIVKVTGTNRVTIEAKHEEKDDEHGQIYRHFIRKHVLPDGCDVNELECILSSDGVLTIIVPCLCEQFEHRVIPITKTDEPEFQEVEDE